MNLDELKKEIEERDAWKKAHPIKAFFKDLPWKFYRAWSNHISMYPKEIKWFIQRGKRGYADCDVWSIDWYLDSWLPEAIRDLKGGMGFPSDLYDNKKEDDECWKWQVIFEDIAKGFEASRKIKNHDFDLNSKTEYKELERVMKKGLNLFVKYYGNLWD